MCPSDYCKREGGYGTHDIALIKLASETVLFNKVYRDATTKLLNKRRFEEMVSELKQQGMEQSGSVLYWSIDIQGFKTRQKTFMLVFVASRK